MGIVEKSDAVQSGQGFALWNVKDHFLLNFMLSYLQNENRHNTRHRALVEFKCDKVYEKDSVL